MDIKLIITGATGMVGEGVLLYCLENADVKEVLMVNRRPYNMQHPKLKELIVPDFFKVEDFSEQLRGYNACFYCAGISSIGVNEADFTRATYDLVVHFAKTLSTVNHDMVFTYVSGSHTDSTEQGKVMWARVKGRTENALTRLSFKKAYNFRPGIMKPMPGQKNIKTVIKIFLLLFPVFRLIFPNQSCTLHEVGAAMVNCVLKGYHTETIEVPDIKTLAN